MIDFISVHFEYAAPIPHDCFFTTTCFCKD